MHGRPTRVYFNNIGSIMGEILDKCPIGCNAD